MDFYAALSANLPRADDRGIVVIGDWKENHLPPPREVNISGVGGPNEVKSTYTIAYWHHVHCIVRLQPSIIV
jgi:hypothetical protein